MYVKQLFSEYQKMSTFNSYFTFLSYEISSSLEFLRHVTFSLSGITKGTMKKGDYRIYISWSYSSVLLSVLSCTDSESHKSKKQVSKNWKRQVTVSCVKMRNLSTAVVLDWGAFCSPPGDTGAAYRHLSLSSWGGATATQSVQTKGSCKPCTPHRRWRLPIASELKMC